MNGEMAWPAADAAIAKDVPVIFLSGYGEAAYPERYRALPRLSKPFEPSRLLVEIRRLLPH